MITLRSCSSKWVNNQMEVNDRPIQSGGEWLEHDQGFKGWSTTFTMVIYQKLVHFLMSLNSGGTCAHCLCLFFNEHEVRIKTARLIQSYNKNVSFKMAIFQIFAPHPFFMQVRKRPIQKEDKWSLFACTPKGLHAPRYKIEFRGYPSIYRQNMLVLSGKVYLLQVTKDCFIHSANETLLQRCLPK